MNKTYLTNPPKAWTIGLWCCSIILLSTLIYYATGIVWCFWGYVLFMGLLGLMYICKRWNYPVLHDDHMEIKHLLPFIQSERYRYEDIESITIPHVPFHNPCLSIALKQSSSKRFHDINCVAFDTLDIFISELKEKGISASRGY